METHDERIEQLQSNITKMLYVNICRGLFEAHKLIYSFLICSSIQRQAKHISDPCWNLLLRGAGIFNRAEQPPRPESLARIVPDLSWDLAYCLQLREPERFGSLCQEICDNSAEWEDYVANEGEDYFDKMPCNFHERLDSFERLLILKIFKPEKLLFACSKFVRAAQGKLYAESPVATMDALFGDSDKKTPVIFVLSAGADPTQ